MIIRFLFKKFKHSAREIYFFFFCYIHDQLIDITTDDEIQYTVEMTKVDCILTMNHECVYIKSKLRNWSWKLCVISGECWHLLYLRYTITIILDSTAVYNNGAVRLWMRNFLLFFFHSEGATLCSVQFYVNIAGVKNASLFLYDHSTKLWIQIFN